MIRKISKWQNAWKSNKMKMITGKKTLAIDCRRRLKRSWTISPWCINFMRRSCSPSSSSHENSAKIASWCTICTMIHCPFSTAMKRMASKKASLSLLMRSTRMVDLVCALRVYSRDAPFRFFSVMRTTNTPKIMISKNQSIAKVSKNLISAHTAITPKRCMMLPLGKAN